MEKLWSCIKNAENKDTDDPRPTAIELFSTQKSTFKAEKYSEKSKDKIKLIIKKGKAQKFFYAINTNKKVYKKYKSHEFLNFWKEELLTLDINKQGYRQNFKFKPQHADWEDSNPDSWKVHPLDIMLGLTCQHYALVADQFVKHCQRAIFYFTKKNIHDAIRKLREALKHEFHHDKVFTDAINQLQHHYKHGDLISLVSDSNFNLDYVFEVGKNTERDEDDFNLQSLYEICCMIKTKIVDYQQEIFKLLDHGIQYGNFSCMLYRHIYFCKDYDDLTNSIKQNNSDLIQIKKEGVRLFNKMHNNANQAVKLLHGIGWILKYLVFNSEAEFYSRLYTKLNKKNFLLFPEKRHFFPKEINPTFLINKLRSDATCALLYADELLPFCRNIAHNSFCGEQIFGFHNINPKLFSLSDIFEKNSIKKLILKHGRNSAFLSFVREQIREQILNVYQSEHDRIAQSVTAG